MPVFLFSDIEGLTKLRETYPDKIGTILNRYNEILKSKIEEFGGFRVKHTDDEVFAVFEDGDPLLGAIEIQKAVLAEEWGGLADNIKVRVGLHLGKAEKHGGRYFGSEVNKAARLLDVGWGGQILLTDQVVLSCQLPRGAKLVDYRTHILKDLGEPLKIYGLLHCDLPSEEFSYLRSLNYRPNNLPIQNTPFINRKKEIEEISSILDNRSCRLLTLIGPGGIGKTRLALQVAAERIDKYGDGVFFVPLETLESHEFVVQKIADSIKLNLQGTIDPKEQLLDYLKGKHILLLLDNLEHIIEAAETVYDMLQAAPSLQILTTSHRSLDLHNEWLFEVTGFTVNFDDSIDEVTENEDAVQLFLESVRRVRKDVKIRPGEKEAIVDICRFVEGVPLGIELAATRAQFLDYKDIAFEIEQSLGFLRTKYSDIPERQRSLRGVFEYSWQLLSEKEKDMLRCVSVFSGGFSMAAAEEVVGASISDLSSLIDKSFLRRTEWGRFEIHPALKQFSEQKLEDYSKDKEAIRNKHYLFFADFVDNHADAFDGEGCARALSEMDEEIDNIRTGWNAAIKDSNSGIIQKYLQGLFVYYEIKGWFKEGAKAFRKAAGVLEDDKSPDYAAVLSRLGYFEYQLGNVDEARGFVLASLGILQKSRDEKEIAMALRIIAQLEYSQANIDEAEEYIARCKDISSRMDNEPGMASCLNLLGRIANARGKYDEAKGLFLASLDIWKSLQGVRHVASLFNNLGIVCRSLGEHEMARGYYEESLIIKKQVNEPGVIITTLLNLGNIAKDMEDYSGAKSYYLDAMENIDWLGDMRLKSKCLNNLGAIAQDMGDCEKAREYHIESLNLNNKLGDRAGIIRSLDNLGEIAILCEDYIEAREILLKALRLSKEIEHPVLTMDILLNFAKLLIEEGERENPLSILVMILDHPSALPPMKAEVKFLLSELEVQLREDLSSEEIESLIKRGEKQEYQGLIERILADGGVGSND